MSRILDHGGIPHTPESLKAANDAWHEKYGARGEWWPDGKPQPEIVRGYWCRPEKKYHSLCGCRARGQFGNVTCACGCHRGAA